MITSTLAALIWSAPGGGAHLTAGEDLPWMTSFLGEIRGPHGFPLAFGERR